VLQKLSWIKLKPLAVLSVLLCASAISFGAQSQGLSPDRNTHCPVTPAEAIDPLLSASHDGREVYFCCKSCWRSFTKDPGYYRKGLAKVWPAAFGLAPGEEPAEQAKQPNHGEQPSHGGPGHSHASEHDAEPSPSAHADTGHAHDHHASEKDSSPTASHTTPASTAPTQTSGSHDHAAHGHADTTNASTATRLRVWIGKFHVPATHFPVALLIVAASLEAWILFTGREANPLRPAITVIATLGAASVVGVSVLGWFNGGFRLTDPKMLMSFHRWFGTAAGLWGLVLLPLALSQWRSAGKPTNAFRSVLMVGAALVAVTGFLGGALVFGLDHLAW